MFFRKIDLKKMIVADALHIPFRTSLCAMEER